MFSIASERLASSDKQNNPEDTHYLQNRLPTHNWEIIMTARHLSDIGSTATGLGVLSTTLCVSLATAYHRLIDDSHVVSSQVLLQRLDLVQVILKRQAASRD